MMTKNKDDEKPNSFIVAFTFAVLEIKKTMMMTSFAYCCGFESTCNEKKK
jgi:hypothetical protein